MKKRIANLNFKEALSQKFPQKSKLANTLANILYVEKEAIYRRLRGDVPFSFEEIALISKTLRISIDQVLGIEMQKQRPLVMQMIDFENPTEEDYTIWKNHNQLLAQFVKNKSLFTFETWTSIPFPFCYKYYHLTKFYLLKWAFQFNNHIPIKRFDEIHLDTQFYELGLESYDLYMQGSSSDYLLTNFVFAQLIKDVNFFHTIGCISHENMNAISKEMDSCLNEWEQLTIEGVYPATGRKINVYITDINIDTSYTLLQSNRDHVTLLRTFILNSVASTDENTFQHIKSSFNALKRLSTRISISGEKDRVKYFQNERNMVEEMKNKFT